MHGTADQEAAKHEKDNHCLMTKSSQHVEKINEHIGLGEFGVFNQQKSPEMTEEHSQRGQTPHDQFCRRAWPARARASAVESKFTRNPGAP